MADTEGSSRGMARLMPALILAALAIAAYGAMAAYTLFNGHTFAGEVSALVRGWWYVTGQVNPYSAVDATRQMPLYFYEIGRWQELAGLGHLPARALSIALGAASGVILFLICRRLTANTTAAAAAAFIFLATPATGFYFATATSAATVAALHLLAVWMIIASMGKPREWMSVLMGIACAALFFTSQNMIAAVIVLVALYIIAVGRDRIWQGAMVAIAIIVTSALVIAAFPPKLAHTALQLPGLSSLLADTGLLGANYPVIARGTHLPASWTAPFSVAGARELLDSFLLPYAGTIVLAAALFAAARGPLKVLWVVPLYFLWLVAAHYLGWARSCDTCLLEYAPQFIGIGAMAAALTLTMSVPWARARGFAAAIVIIVGAIGAVAVNALAPVLATQPSLKFFPRAMVQDAHPAAEMTEMPALARWIASNMPAKDPILVIHGLGAREAPSLPYAVFLGGYPLPEQSFDLKASKRTINQSLVGAARETVQGALEEESLWSDDTMRRWIERDYDTILFQEDAAPESAALLKAIEARFVRAGSIRYRGDVIILLKRRAAT